MRRALILSMAAIQLAACAGELRTKPGGAEASHEARFSECVRDAETAHPDPSLNLSRGDLFAEAIIDRGYTTRECMEAHDRTATGR